MISRIVHFLRAAPLYKIIPFFLILPCIVLLLKRSGISIVPATNLMIANMLLLSGLCFLRGGLLLNFSSRQVPQLPSHLSFTETQLSPELLQAELVRHGYRLHRCGGYAERGLRGILTALFLLLLGFALAVGSYDNLFQFRGAVQVGTGDPAVLSDPNYYSMYNHGPLMRLGMMKVRLKGVDRILPNSRYRYGAAEIRILGKKGQALWQGILEPFGPGHEQDGFLYSLNSLQYNLGIIVMTTKNHLLFTDWLHLYPLKQPVEGFTHSGEMKTDKLNDFDGKALYNEVTERLQLRLRHKDRHFDVELGEAPNHEKVIGEYRVLNQGTARLSQVDVMRVRHTKWILALAGCAALAGVSALFARRQRVWFRGNSGGGGQVAAEDQELMDTLRESRP